MTLTFGEYLLARRVHRLSVNPEFVRRIQAVPGLAAVTTFDELLEITGRLTPAEEITIKIFWRAYAGLLRAAKRRGRDAD